MKYQKGMLIGMLVLTVCLYGCGGKHVSEPSPNGTPSQLQVSDETFVLCNPLTDSPHNPLVRKFGDIPQVRTYMTLQRKFLTGTSLTIDEAIALTAADLHLYPSEMTAKRLKRLKEVKNRLETGSSSGFEYRYSGGTVFDLRTGDSIVVYHPDGSKTVNDFRNPDGKPIVVPPPKRPSEKP